MQSQIPIIPQSELNFIPASNQRIGDAVIGKNYLLEGDYVGSGIPFDLFTEFYGTDNSNELGRTGLNENITHNFNAFTNNNGIDLVSPNCFNCHAARLNGELIVGLGNSFSNYTTDQTTVVSLLDGLVSSTYGNNSLEWEGYFPFSRGTAVTAGQLVTQARGVNPADKLAAVLSSYRDPNSLEWTGEETLDIPEKVVPTDTPPWWWLKKKNAMFYNAIGRGDFARISMASSLLTLNNTEDAAEIDAHFPDVIAYIMSLEPPPYPESIDESLADTGEQLFLDHCSTCHGTYGANESYPNLVVNLDLIQTDSMLVTANFGYERFTNWYNGSWFNTGDHAAFLEPTKGYIAPPLDGVWATAPYLHNGSVPNLQSLLNSDERPEYWTRMFDSYDYNYERIGWNYTELDSKVNSNVYDVNLEGYSNKGHYFGDHLTPNERSAIIEYLKTI